MALQLLTISGAASVLAGLRLPHPARVLPSSSPLFEIDPNPEAYPDIVEIQVILTVWKQVVGSEGKE